MTEPYAELLELHETTRDVCSTLDIDEVLAAMVRRANRMLDGDVAYIATCHEADRVLRIRAHDHLRTEEFARLTIPYDCGLGGAVAATRVPMRVEDYLGDPAEFRHLPEVDDPVRSEGLTSAAGAPVQFGDKLLAVLFVARREVRGFTDHDMTILASLANSAAIALNNAQVHGRLVNTLAVHEKLMTVALADLGPQAVAGTLAELIDGPVLLLDWRGRAVCSSARGGRAIAGAEDLGGSGSAIPLRLGGEVEGHLLARPGISDTEMAAIAVGQAATVFALELAKLRSAEQTSLRLRGGLLTELLNPPLRDEAEVVLRARRLGCDLERPHVVAVVRAAGGEALSERQRQRLAQLFGRPETASLVAERGDDLVLLVPAAQGPVETTHGLRRAIAGVAREGAGLPAVVAGVGGVTRGPGDYEASFVEAARAAADAQQTPERGPVVAFAELDFFQVLLGARPDPEVVDRARGVLGPLIDYDVRRDGQLVETLRVYLDCASNAEAAARRLTMHPNGIRARVAKISALLGRDLSQASTRLNLQLALETLALASR